MQLKLELLRHSINSTGGRSNKNFNCFVRLHPSTVQTLYNRAIYLYQQQQQQIQTKNLRENQTSKCWQIVHENEKDVVFLPLKITLQYLTKTISFYVSYNGGLSDKEDTIEVNEALIHDQSLLNFLIKSKIEIDVEPLYNVSNATTIHLDPLSTHDWELMEVFADNLESGLLLSQISIVSPNQIVPLLVGSDLVYLRVLETSFTCTDKNDTSIRLMNTECSRLIAESEVIITPKPRKGWNKKKTPNKFKLSVPMRIQPTKDDYSTDMIRLFNHINLHGNNAHTMIPTPPLFHVWMHPTSLSCALDGWNSYGSSDKKSAIVFLKKVKKTYSYTQYNDKKSSDREALQSSQSNLHVEKNDSVAVAKISSSDLIPLGCVALHPYICLELDVAPFMDFVQLQLLTPLEIQNGMTFIDDSLSLRLYPCLIRDNSNAMVHERSWRLPEAFSYKTSSWFKSSGRQKQSRAGLSLSTSTISDVIGMNDIFYKGNPIISNGSIIQLPFEMYHDVNFYEVKLNVTGAQNECRASQLKHQFLLAKEILDVHTNFVTNKRNHIAIDYNDRNNCSVIRIPNTYMLNVLPTSLLPTPGILNAAENAAMKLLDKRELMIKGDKGCGKSYLSLLVAAKLRMNHNLMTSYVDCRQLQSSLLRMDEILQELTDTFKQAVMSSPCLLVLDNIDVLLPKIESDTADEGQKQRISPDFGNQVQLLKDHIYFLIEGIRQSNRNSHFGVAVLMTCQHKTHVIHQSMGCNPLSVFEVPSLVSSELIDLFQQMLYEKIGNTAASVDFETQITENLQGYNPLDLKSATERIAASFRNSSQKTNSDVLLKDCIHEVLSTYVPVSHQSLDLNKSEPEISWCNIGGLFQAKLDLSEAILQPIKYKLIYDHLPVNIPKGILLFGPPGCGKSCIIPALASQCKYNLITCRGPELFDKYIGASEAKVRKLFEKAYAAAPSILFLDEFDALAPRRGSDNTGVTDRVVNQLLTFLDGVEVHENEDVYIIAASSRPDKIDPALLRPGRLEFHVFIGFASSEEEWCDLFTKIALKNNVKEELKESILDKTFFTSIFQQGISYLKFSAADIKGILDTAHLHAVHEFIELGPGKSSDILQIDRKHLLDAFKSSRPSLPESDRKALARAYMPFIGKGLCEEIRTRALGLKSSDCMSIGGVTDSDLRLALK